MVLHGSPTLGLSPAPSSKKTGSTAVVQSRHGAVKPHPFIGAHAPALA